MASFYILGAILGSICFTIAATAAASSGESIQDLLRDHGLPAGLLPLAVSSFELHQETGLLEVHLDRPCYAKYDGLIFFNQTVSGNLSYGNLKGLVGLSQEELFLWLPVKEITVTDPSSGVILFDMGVAQKQLSLSLFENPPHCSSEGERKERGVLRLTTQGRSNGKIGFRLVAFDGELDPVLKIHAEDDDFYF